MEENNIAGSSVNDNMENENENENTQDPYRDLSYEEAIERLREVEGRVKEKDEKLSKLHKTITREKQAKEGLYTEDQLKETIQKELSAYEKEVNTKLNFVGEYGEDSWDLVKKYVQENENIGIEQAAKIVGFDIMSGQVSKSSGTTNAFSSGNDVLPERLIKNRDISQLSDAELLELAKKGL